MNDLLKLAVDAHGGLARWNELQGIRCEASIGGALWDLKSQPGLFRQISIQAHFHEQFLVTHLPYRKQRIVYTPHQVSLETEDGSTIAVRNDPRCSFQLHERNTPWDELHAGYFSSCALWTYLTVPFLFTNPVFAVQEMEPWTENKEQWRVLNVQFPEAFASHCSQQRIYIGSDGLLRRHEYTVDVLGGAPGLNYVLEYAAVDGLRLPVTRRVFAYDEQRRKVADPLLVSIDLTNVRVW